MTPELSEDVIEDVIDEATEDVDELLQQITELRAGTETRDAEITRRLDECQTTLQNLSSTVTAENPLLSQILLQLTETKVELARLQTMTQSMDTTLKARQQPNSETPTVENPPEDEPNQDALTDEQGPEDSQTEQAPPKVKKHRFI